MPFKNSYKFDVISKGKVKVPEAMPKFFLSDNKEEAEKIYEDFKDLINILAYNYARYSGLDKADIFGEALIGLGRAYRDWDKERGTFKNYALFMMKDAIHEFMRDHGAVVKVPSYIKKAARNYGIVEDLCEAFSLNIIDVLYGKTSLLGEEFNELRTAVANVKNAALRAKVPLEKFIVRIFQLPEEVDYSVELSSEEPSETESQLTAALIVSKLKMLMDETELKICHGIMEGKTYQEIGEELGGKSKSWVANKLATFRQKAIDHMTK
jgi:RNA polymerase sigma factor (sigma-70 family)